MPEVTLGPAVLELRDRRIYRVGDHEPAVWLIDDRELGGILVNAPPHSASAAAAIQAVTKPAYLFLPSRHGAQDLDAWRGLGIEVLAFEAEAPAIEAAGGRVDIAFNRKQRLSRTIDFLPMAGRTEGSCALRLKNLPGVVFFGPTLSPDEDGWPSLIANPDDHSWEARLFGALGVKDLKFDYAFCDRHDPESTRFGPGADAEIQARIEAVFA